MAKKFPMKGAGVVGSAGATKTGFKHKKAEPSSMGDNALKTQHWTATDGRGQMKGIEGTRHHTIKPTASSGSVGKAQSLKMAKGTGREERGSDNPLGGKIYKSTKNTR